MKQYIEAFAIFAMIDFATTVKKSDSKAHGEACLL